MGEKTSGEMAVCATESADRAEAIWTAVARERSSGDGMELPPMRRGQNSRALEVRASKREAARSSAPGEVSKACRGGVGRD